MIDRALEQKPADFDVLLNLLSEMGCKVSRRGKVIWLKVPGWKNAARMDDKLGAKKSAVQQPELPKVNLLVGIQAKLQAGKGVGSIWIGC